MLLVALFGGFIGCNISTIENAPIYAIYFIAVFFGFAGSIMITVSLTLTANLIGHNVVSIYPAAKLIQRNKISIIG